MQQLLEVEEQKLEIAQEKLEIKKRRLAIDEQKASFWISKGFNWNFNATKCIWQNTA